MPEYIEREAAKKLAKQVDNGVPWSMRSVLLLLDSVPAADVEPVRHGRWEYWDGWTGNHDLRIDATCSLCGYKHPPVCPTKDKPYTPDNLPPRCPACLAKMDLKEGTA